MTETRQPSQQQTQEDVAAEIAVLLAAGGATSQAVALALLPLLPISIIRLPDLSALISLSVAELVLRGPPTPEKGGQGNLEALMEDLIYRAMYGVNALARLVEAAGGEEEGREGRIEKALRAEESYFKAHLEQQDSRRKGRNVLSAMIDAYGRVLSWHAVERPTSRPHHLAADGMNYDTSNGIPQKTRSLPGVLPHCLCYWGPPIDGARMMN